MKEKPRHMMAPAKNAPNTIFSWSSISIEGRIKKKIAIPMKATHPSKWVQIFAVSVCRRKILLKQALKLGNGGL